MRLQIVNSKNSKSLYVVKSTYINKKRSNKVVEKLGTYKELEKKLAPQDPIEWAKNYVNELNKKEKNGTREILIKYSPVKFIDKNSNFTFNCGYLFLEKIYYQLGIDKICEEISKNSQFKYNLNDILSRLVYGRIIFPSSKMSTFELSKKFIEQPTFQLHDIYRALEVIANENDFIQAKLYENSKNVIDRTSKILYYDCTNYFFEIEQEDEFRKYGVSKEHRPNPIVQMGLFMDGNGIPLAFGLNSGNTNEQTTLTPLEEKILKDFNLSKIVVCTDAGLASVANRKFNDTNNRAFITTQSIKQLKKYLMDWALSPTGWRLSQDNKEYNINTIENNEETFNIYKDKIFFKERWIKENGLEQKLIVTFSLKYKEYQRNIRNAQIERARLAIANKDFKLNRKKQTDFKRLIKQTEITKDGEIANKKILSLDTEIIENEEKFDGFYSVCTNLEDSPEEIIKVNKRRWEIEESFRIMKSEFKARPVYLSKENRIKAHFMTCFIALLIHRILEKKLNEEFTSTQIIECLRDMNLMKIKDENYIPTYTRTDLTDYLHEKFEFRTDYEIIKNSKMKNILKKLKR